MNSLVTKNQTIIQQEVEGRKGKVPDLRVDWRPEGTGTEKQSSI